MIIINEAAPNDNTYVISICESKFRAYAQNEAEAIEVIGEYFISKGKSDWYFSAFEVELMAKSARKTVDDFVTDADLCYCSKQNIYLPKLKITKEI